MTIPITTRFNMKKLLYRIEYFYKIYCSRNISFPSQGLVKYVFSKRKSNKLTYTYECMAHTYVFAKNKEEGVNSCIRFYSRDIDITRERVRQLLWKFVKRNKRYLK